MSGLLILNINQVDGRLIASLVLITYMAQPHPVRARPDAVSVLVVRMASVLRALRHAGSGEVTEPCT